MIEDAEHVKIIKNLEIFNTEVLDNKELTIMIRYILDQLEE